MRVAIGALRASLWLLFAVIAGLSLSWWLLELASGFHLEREFIDARYQFLLFVLFPITFFIA
jgi:hypothetical protein